MTDQQQQQQHLKSMSVHDLSTTSTTSTLGCWKQRTGAEKMLLVLLVSLFLGFGVAVAILVNTYLRLEERLLAVHGKPSIVTDDSIHHDLVASIATIPPFAVQEPEVCVSVECIEVAARILTSLDDTFDPCEDMSRFACGGWTRRTMETPNSKDVVMILEDLQLKVDHRLKLVLESPSRDSDLKSYAKVRRYFRSCMAENQDSARLASVGRIVQELGPLRPPSATNGSQPEGLDLTELLERIIQYNGAPLFDLGVQVDDRNASRYVINVALPRQSAIMPQFYSNLPHDLLDLVDVNWRESAAGASEGRSRQRRHYPDFFDESTDETGEMPFVDDPALFSAEALGLFQGNGSFLTSIQQISRDQKTVAALRLLRDIGAFRSFSEEEYKSEEASLRRFMNFVDRLTPSDREKKIRQQTTRILNYYTVPQLDQQFDFVNWTAILGRTVGHGVVIDDVVVHYPEILQQIHQMIKATQDKRTVHNAVIVLTVRDLLLELFKPAPGIEKWQFCLQATKGGFGDVLSGIYVRQFSQLKLDTFKSKAQDIFLDLKESIVETIQQSDWLDPISRRRAVRKAKRLQSNLVSPDMFFNTTYLEEVVAEVNIDEAEDFVNSTWRMFGLFRRDFFQLFRKPVDPVTVTWQMLAYPIMANAFYLQHFNSMVLPLALLDDPLFSMETPRYLSLGTLGFIIAHEIMHGFDNSGVEFDENGVRNDILSADSQQIFRQKMDCVASQYSNTFRTEFSHNGSSVVLHVDGLLTLNENVADLGAIKAIVKTHEKWMRRNPVAAARLPGIKYNEQQLMLINAAQAYCAVINPQAYALILGMDEHAPPHDRVNGFMMNLPEYGRIFNCPAGSRLNPVAKCSVW